MRTILKIGTTLFLFAILLSSCQKETEALAISENLSFQESSLTTDLNAEQQEIVLRNSRRGAGGVYIMDNDPAGNHILAFARQADGSLNGPVSYATGGNGTGGGLGSQGSIIAHGSFLFAVNAGSNEISAFFVVGSQLILLDKVYSEGVMPTSLTYRGNILYVLNAGGDGNIAGFRFENNENLVYIEGSSQSLSSTSAAAAQVSFNPAGNTLVVTERATNLITTYPVGPDGVAGPGTSFASAGPTPFGFEFRFNGQMIVSEAAGGAPNASSASLYSMNSGALNLMDGPEPTNQTAACWLVVTNNGRFAYTTNTGSGSVSGYRVNNFGLELLDEDGVTGVTGAGPIDMDLSRSSKFLYTINNGGDSISMFEVNQSDGSLTHIGEVTGLPATALGLAAQ